MLDGGEQNEALLFKIKPELYAAERHLLIQVGIKSGSYNQNNAPSENNAQCPHCKKLFVDKKCLLRHVANHSNHRPFTCQVCSKSFMLNGDLKRHNLTHSGDRPFACEVCGRRFTLKGNLMQHFRTHVPEKQFSCTICQKAFAQRDSLYRHIRAHFGEKPYCCSTCDRKFSLKGDLGRHELIHSGTKPHVCPVCGRRFALKGNMTQHMRIHNKAPEKGSNQKAIILGELKLPLGPNQLEVAFSDKPIEKCPIFKNEPCLPKAPCPGPQWVVEAVPSNTPPNEPHLTETVYKHPIGFGGNSFPGPVSSIGIGNSFSLSKPEITGLYPVNPNPPVLVNPSHNLNYVDTGRHGPPAPTPSEKRHEQHQPPPKVPQVLLCGTCHKSFQGPVALEEHMSVHHGLSKAVACPMCKKPFKNCRNMKLHLRRHETAKANFVCPTCGSSFLSKSDHFFHTCHILRADKGKEFPKLQPHRVSKKEDPSPEGYGGFLSPFYRHIYLNTSSNTNLSMLKEHSTNPTLQPFHQRNDLANLQ